MKRYMIFFALIVLPIMAISNNKLRKEEVSDDNIKVSKDYVPDQETAEKIAEAIWFPIYGDRIYNQKPYIISSIDSIWIVKGSLPSGKKGGTAYIEIRKRDCKILKVTHGK